jgi:hypothetical protein
VKHTQPSSFTWETDKAGMQKFLEITPEIEVANYSLMVSKADLIERLK